MVDNIMRSESILILPQNTLRLTDLMLQMEIYNAEGKLLQENFDNIIWKLVNRKNKDLSLYNRGVNKDLLDEIYKAKFAEYYDMSPRTLMYEIIGIMTNQKFIKRTVVLFSNKKAVDDTFECDYYDGSIESLERYINENNITCLVFDDIELLKILNDRKNVILNGKTFFVSKIGYNFYKDRSGNFQLKYYEKIRKENKDMELSIIDLYNFSKTVIDKHKGANKNE